MSLIVPTSFLEIVWGRRSRKAIPRRDEMNRIFESFMLFEILGCPYLLVYGLGQRFVR